MLVAKRKPEKLKTVKTLRNSAPDVPAKYALMTLLEEVMVYIEKIVSAAASKKYMEIVSLTPLLLNKLKNHGIHLDESYTDELNNAYCELRDCSLLEEVGVDARLCLLYLIELRAASWQQPHDFTSYFNSRPIPFHECQIEVGDGAGSLLNPGELLKESGKFPSPTRIPGKTYCKDEVVIRNADSGKVMGIRGRRVHMIEELSETVISFQRVNPGAKERLVQITGPSEDNIELAKQLMESTIRRNASPVREDKMAELCGSNSSLNSSTSDETNSRILSNSIGGRLKKKGGHNLETGQFEYKHSVDSSEGTIHLSSHNLNLLKNAKIILDEHLANEMKSEPATPKTLVSGKSEEEKMEPIPQQKDHGVLPPDTKPKTKPIVNGGSPLIPHVIEKPKMEYSREFLLECALCSLGEPSNWPTLAAQFPHIVRQPVVKFDAELYKKRWAENEGKSLHVLPTEVYPDSD